MKILLIAPQPFFEKRGTPLAVGLLCTAFGDLHHDVDLLTYHLGEDRSYPSVRHFRAAKIRFVKSVKKGLSGTKLFLDVFVFLKALRLLMTNKYDCIHCVEEGVFMGILLKYIFKVPVVYDMDSSIPEQIRDSNSRIWTCFPFPFLAGKLEKWGVINSDLIIAVCKALKQKVEQIAPNIPVCVLEDIPVSEKSPLNLYEDGRRIRNELQLDGNCCIVYTGTFEEYQGIGLLLESIPRVLVSHPSAVFVLVGGLPDQITGVRVLAEKLGVEANLRILGRRPLEEMPAFMEIADILVSPRSMGINTPMKLYSYLQSGKPVVATRLTTHTQVLDDSTAILAEPEPFAFGTAISGLINDRNLRERLGKAGSDLIEHDFTYDAYKNKLKLAYLRLQQCLN